MFPVASNRPSIPTFCLSNPNLRIISASANLTLRTHNVIAVADSVTRGPLPAGLEQQLAHRATAVRPDPDVLRHVRERADVEATRIIASGQAHRPAECAAHAQVTSQDPPRRQIPEALEVSAALNVNNKNAGAWAMRGLAYEKAGKRAEARESYQRALSVDATARCSSRARRWSPPQAGRRLARARRRACS